MKGKPIEVSATAGILSIKIQDREIINERIGDEWLFDISQSKTISYLSPLWSAANEQASIGNHKGAKELRETYHNFNRYVAHYEQVQKFINQNQ